MNQKLLLHIAYYMSNKTRLDNKNGIDKSSKEYTEHVLSGVKQFLAEINKYKGFEKIDVVFDVNSGNVDVNKIDKNLYKNINISINQYNFDSEHPFRLTTKHRFSIIDNINIYDWFAYSEDDTVIDAKSVEFLLNNSIKLYEKEQKVYTIPRLVYDSNNNFFYSDITKPSPIISSSNGKAIIPTNRFGACWFYPQIIIKDWINLKSYYDFNYANKDPGIRERMGLGVVEHTAIIPVNDDGKPLIKCVHLGYCGKYYYTHPDKFHTLPYNKLCN